MMADKPILFSAPMIRALLDGRKTMTRRVLKPQPPQECSIRYMLGQERWLPLDQQTPLRHHWEAWWGALYLARPAKALAGSFTAKMKYAPGDRLWVRESFNFAYRLDDGEMPIGDENVYYMADGQPFDRYMCPKTDEWLDGLPWKPSIHMPRTVSRLTLIVESVKVERLQDINRGDAMEEGCPFANMQAGPNPCDWFRDLWNGINGPDAWDANPWVAAIAFSVVKANIDSIGASHV
jgi:hypothetical protein